MALKTPLGNADQVDAAPARLPVHGDWRWQDRAAWRQYILAKRTDVVMLNAAMASGSNNQCVGGSDASTL
jgi:hypothetical protein